jgi:hypothetical protein
MVQMVFSSSGQNRIGSGVKKKSLDLVVHCLSCAVFGKYFFHWFELYLFKDQVHVCSIHVASCASLWLGESKLQS